MSSTPYACPECKRTGSYTGSLRFDEQPVPVCRNHKTPVEMEAVKKKEKE